MFRTMLLCAALWSVASAAAASSTSPGLVTRIHILNGGIVLFYQTSTRAPAPPACHNSPGRWAFNGTTPAGQAKLSALLSAYAMKKPVTVIGLDNCADWPDTESVNYFVIEE